ncbi:MAG: phosphoenolpyruvate--protein phosphotransferase, partial [Desulfatitalea sp.]|nr:phosphoenolpyruvate--protein phosphotransferase [Desulfatitalea sp.]NNJ83696.1 phosphoenolpyruvate--protein phosphotransferase [Gammaproteobacteria bacterium]
VLHLLKFVIDAADRRNIPVFMCGEMAGESLFVPILLGLGLKELSTNPQTIPVIKNAVRLINVDQARSFVDLLLKQATTDQIERLIESTYGDLLSNGNHKAWER